jgi:hypothetical protein
MAVGEQKQENTFFAEGRSAVAGILTPVFPIGIETKRKKRKEKQKRKERTKEKKRFIIYIFALKR